MCFKIIIQNRVNTTQKLPCYAINANITSLALSGHAINSDERLLYLPRHS